MEHSVLEQFKLNGRTALIVGGNRGLGLAMARAFAEAGANIAIASRDQEANQCAENEIKSSFNVDCTSFVCDVTCEARVKEVVKETVARFGKIDILVNSAGINIRGKIEELSVDDFNKVQQVNV